MHLENLFKDKNFSLVSEHGTKIINSRETKLYNKKINFIRKQKLPISQPIEH